MKIYDYLSKPLSVFMQEPKDVSLCTHEIFASEHYSFTGPSDFLSASLDTSVNRNADHT